MSTELRTLWVLSAFFAVLAVLYGITAYEPAGTVLLALCGVTTLVASVPLRPRRAHEREAHDDAGAADGTDDLHDAEVAEPVHEAPVESLWPFVAGIGTVLVVNGLVLGPWLLVPGLVLVARGLYGSFVQQA